MKYLLAALFSVGIVGGPQIAAAEPGKEVKMVLAENKERRLFDNERDKTASEKVRDRKTDNDTKGCIQSYIGPFPVCVK